MYAKNLAHCKKMSQIFSSFGGAKKYLCRFCHATEKSEAIATCKEMPVILVIRVVDKKTILTLKSQMHLQYGVFIGT
jgi:hypothetical protein